MGLDLVRKICEEAKIDWRKPMPVPAKVQHTVIQRHAAREHEYLRYLSPNGRAKYDVVGQLCWLARESVIKCSTTKDGRRIPLIKIHLDISERVLSELETDDPEKWAMLQDLIHKGVLFPLDTSRAREQHQGTMRFQIRRILLARPVAPLGRHTSIRIDNREALRFLLSEPLEFVRGELQLNPSEMLWPDREEE